MGAVQSIHRKPRPPATPPKPSGKERKDDLEGEVAAVVTTLKKLGRKKYRDGMARYAIPTDKAFGVSVGQIQQLGKKLGKNHELAAALWKTGWYEARMLCAFIDDPALVTPGQMDRWCRDFDNWAICDTVCFKLFDQTPHAFRKIVEWSTRRDEFQKRAAFALLASLAVHDKKASDDAFLGCLPLIEQAATDQRNFVKKGVSWALRVIGRRNQALNEAALVVARQLSDSDNSAARWIGRDSVRELTGPVVTRRLKSKSATAKS